MRTLLVPHFLSGVQAKLDRAVETRTAIGVGFAEFCGLRTSGFVIERHTESEGKDHITTARGPTYPPRRLSVLAGECAHQLRSALDHLVFSVVELAGGTATENSQYPICDGPDRFANALASGNLGGLPQPVIDYIQQCQPYQTADLGNSTLRLLREINNQDKHRLLAVVCTAARLGNDVTFRDSGLSPPDRNAPAALVYVSPPVPVGLTPEPTEVCRFTFEYPAPDILVDAEVRISLAFDKLGMGTLVPVLDVLAKMQSLTQRIVDDIGALVAPSA